MSLFAATLIFGLFWIGVGAYLLWKGNPLWQEPIRWMRSTKLAIALFGTGALWFLWHVWNLGDADFGSFRIPLLVAFGGTAVGCFFHCRDLLAARGLAVLGLLWALPLLKAAYMHYESPQRLLLVIGVYVMLTAGIVFGAMPWILRNAFTWLYSRPNRITNLGRGLIGYGTVLAVLSLTY